jgi:hypothetical protein
VTGIGGSIFTLTLRSGPWSQQANSRLAVSASSFVVAFRQSERAMSPRMLKGAFFVEIVPLPRSAFQRQVPAGSSLTQRSSTA